MEKAYDHVEWKVVGYLLGRFCFPVIVRLYLGVHHIHILICVGEWSSCLIKASRGLRQCDPSYHSLFNLVVEALGTLVWKTKELGLVGSLKWVKMER